MHLETRYLIPESTARFERFFRIHPLLAGLTVLGVYGAVLGVLRRMFGKIASDMALFALIISAILIFVGSVLHTLTHVKGFHFGG